ncbi:MAG: hypothetical protein IPK04_12765 [Bdellovibrionales bacterium]|nr:hypothetical protein [Bdellovibrionales bacterium]
MLDIRAKAESRKIKKAIRQILAIDSTEIKVHGSLFSELGWKQKHCKNEHKAAANFTLFGMLMVGGLTTLL